MEARDRAIIKIIAEYDEELWQRDAVINNWSGSNGKKKVIGETIEARIVKHGNEMLRYAASGKPLTKYDVLHHFSGVLGRTDVIIRLLGHTERTAMLNAELAELIRENREAVGLKPLGRAGKLSLRGPKKKMEEV